MNTFRISFPNLYDKLFKLFVSIMLLCFYKKSKLYLFKNMVSVFLKIDEDIDRVQIRKIFEEKKAKILTETLSSR
jgi:hypothetical protein